MVALAKYQAALNSVTDLNHPIEDARQELDGRLDNRDDAATALNGYNARALSAIRDCFGPDSFE